MSKFRLKSLFVFVAIVAVALAAIKVFLTPILTGCYHVRDIDLGNGRWIVVKAETFWEMSQSVYYQVYENHKCVVPLRVFDYAGDGELPTYEVIKGKSGDLVALMRLPIYHEVDTIPDFQGGENWTRQIISDQIVLIHDFRSGTSYPESRSNREKVLAEILNDHPEWDDDLKNTEYVSQITAVDWTYRWHQGNTVTDGDLMHLSRLPNLQSLRLTDQPVDNLSLELLGRLTTLKRLDLDGAKLTDDERNYLRGLRIWKR